MGKKELRIVIRDGRFGSTAELISTLRRRYCRKVCSSRISKLTVSATIDDMRAISRRLSVEVQGIARPLLLIIDRFVETAVLVSSDGQTLRQRKYSSAIQPSSS